MSDQRFHGRGDQLVPGALRGYRCWQLVNRVVGHRVTYDTVHEEYQVGSMRWHNPLFERMVQTTTSRRDVRVVEPVLSAVSWNVYWGGAELEAECEVLQRVGPLPHTADCYCQVCVHDVPHQLPDPRCSCGIYAWYEPTWATAEHDGPVVGVVEATGRTLLGTGGFRASHVKILAVAPNHDYPGAPPYLVLRDALRSRYPDVTVYRDLRELRLHHPSDLATVRNCGVDPEPPVSVDGPHNALVRLTAQATGSLHNLASLAWSAGLSGSSSDERLMLNGRVADVERHGGGDPHLRYISIKGNVRELPAWRDEDATRAG